MRQHLLRLPIRPPFPACILIGANHHLHFRIQGNHRLPRLQVSAHPIFQALKLEVPVGMARAFRGFGMGLQAVPQGRDEKKRVER